MRLIIVSNALLWVLQTLPLLIFVPLLFRQHNAHYNFAYCILLNCVVMTAADKLALYIASLDVTMLNVSPTQDIEYNQQLALVECVAVKCTSQIGLR